MAAVCSVPSTYLIRLHRVLCSRCERRCSSSQRSPDVYHSIKMMIITVDFGYSGSTAINDDWLREWCVQRGLEYSGSCVAPTELSEFRRHYYQDGHWPDRSLLLTPS